jgi:hypothetical protein
LPIPEHLAPPERRAVAISGAQAVFLLVLVLAWTVTLMFAIPWARTVGGDVVQAKVVSVGVVRPSSRVRELDDAGNPIGRDIPVHAAIHGKVNRLANGDTLEVRVDPERRIALATGLRGSGGFLLMAPIALVGTPLLVRRIRATRAREQRDVDSAS